MTFAWNGRGCQLIILHTFLLQDLIDIPIKRPQDSGSRFSGPASPLNAQLMKGLFSAPPRLGLGGAQSLPTPRPALCGLQSIKDKPQSTPSGSLYKVCCLHQFLPAGSRALSPQSLALWLSLGIIAYLLSLLEASLTFRQVMLLQWGCTHHFPVLQDRQSSAAPGARIPPAAMATSASLHMAMGSCAQSSATQSTRQRYGWSPQLPVLPWSPMILLFAHSRIWHCSSNCDECDMLRLELLRLGSIESTGCH